MDVPEGKPTFEQFIQWGFYTVITVLAAIVASNFTDLKEEVTAMTKQMVDLNAKMAVVVEKNQWIDRELIRLDAQSKVNAERLRTLEMRLKP